MKRVIEMLNYVMLLLFTTAAILQYNDPDSFVWIVAYGLAAAGCILWIQETMYYKYIIISLAVIFIAWSIYVIPDATDQQLFGSFGMQSIEIEEMREALGLIISAVWMVVLALVPQRKKELEAKAAV